MSSMCFKDMDRPAGGGNNGSMHGSVKNNRGSAGGKPSPHQIRSDSQNAGIPEIHHRLDTVDDDEDDDGQDTDQHQEEGEAEDEESLLLNTNFEQLAVHEDLDGYDGIDERANSSRFRLDSESAEDGGRLMVAQRQPESSQAR